MSVYLKWEEPKEFTLKKHKENTRSAFKFTWEKVVAGLFFSGFSMLAWYLGTILPQNDTANSHVPFWGALSLSIGFLLLIFVIGPLIVVKSSPPKIRVKVTGRGIWLIDSKLNRTWRFADIAVFSIFKGPMGEPFGDVLNLRDFDGRTVAIGVSSQIPTETLESLLSERIGEVRSRIKHSQMNPWKSWEYLVGIILLSIGLMALSFSTSLFFDIRHDRKDSSNLKDNVKKVKLQFESENSTLSQNEAFGKVATRAYYASYKTIDIEMSQLLMVIGAAGTVVLLLGLNLIMWARSRRFYNRMRKLEIMCSERSMLQTNSKRLAEPKTSSVA